MTAKRTVTHLLRAPWNFEEDYFETWNHLPVSGDIPILFTYPYTTTPPPAGTPDPMTAIDQEAIRDPPPTGVSPVLAKMVAAPIGSTLCFYFPIVSYNMVVAPVTTWAYVWRVVFRFRSLADFNRRHDARVPYSIPSDTLGVPDTRWQHAIGRPTAPLAGPRTVRPATVEAMIYNRSQPSPNDPNPFGMLKSDAVAIPCTPNTITTHAPYYPGAHGAAADEWSYVDWEQGEHDVGIAAQETFIQTGPSHVEKFLKCAGNEFAVECSKYNYVNGATTGPRNWDFTFDVNGNVVGGEDWPFSILLGVGARGLSEPYTPPVETGVRVIAGGWPY